MGDNDRGGYVYDLDTLRRGLQSVKDNIAVLEEALKKERDKQREYENHITGAEAILALHGHDGKN